MTRSAQGIKQAEARGHMPEGVAVEVGPSSPLHKPGDPTAKRLDRQRALAIEAGVRDRKPVEAEAGDLDFRHLLDLIRALRLAQKGSVSQELKPDKETAQRLELALDYLIAEYDDRDSMTDGGQPE